MIYLDNAATSFPKPQCVYSAVYEYMKKYGANAGRGGYKTAAYASELLYSARENVSELIGNTNPQQLIFTKNATEALNIAIRGCVKFGDNVVISPVEHNSVIRPLNRLNANITRLPLNADGSYNIDMLNQAITPKTSLVIINHASNVSGIINDIEKAGEICKRRCVKLLVDASQSAGTIQLNASETRAMIAFAGHKSMMGPMGTGCLYIPENIDIYPLITGGTGSESKLTIQPETLPDKFESGTLNMPGIYALGESCKYIKNIGLKNIYYHEQQLTERLINGLSEMKRIKILYPKTKNRTSALSFVIENIDCAEVGRILDSEYDIAVRCGFHCAPEAHKAFGTYDTGTIRASVGWYNTKQDIDKILWAIGNICKKKK